MNDLRNLGGCVGEGFLNERKVAWDCSVGLGGSAPSFLPSLVSVNAVSLAKSETNTWAWPALLDSV